MSGFSTAAEHAAISDVCSEHLCTQIWAGIPVLWKLLPGQPAGAQKTSSRQFRSLTETNGKPGLPAESCRETLLGGNAISVLHCTQEQEAMTQLWCQRQQLFDLEQLTLLACSSVLWRWPLFTRVTFRDWEKVDGNCPKSPAWILATGRKWWGVSSPVVADV